MLLLLLFCASVWCQSSYILSVPLFHQLCPELSPTLRGVAQYDPLLKTVNYSEDGINVLPGSCKNTSNNCYRVGKFDESVKALVGSAGISGVTLEEIKRKYSEEITLYIDRVGKVYHVDYSVVSKNDIESPTVLLSTHQDIIEASKPLLRESIKVKTDGSVQEPPVEQSFIQKYGIYIGIAIIFLVFSTSRGDA
jgi:hypothetical protein